jgi:multidrug resistance efflux pump
MKQKPIAVLVVVLVLLALAAGGYLAARSSAGQEALARLGVIERQGDRLVASGFIEAEQVSIAAEVGGRIAEILVAEGDRVEEGQVLVRLNDDLARAQLELAQAGLEVAQATLDQVRAGARPEEIRQAEADLAQAEAARDGAYQAWQDLLAMIDNPQELDAQIALAELQLAQAEAELEQANALRDMAAIANDAFQDAREQYPAGTTFKVLVASGSITDVLPTLPPELVELIESAPDGTYRYEDWEIVLTGGTVAVYQWQTVSYPLEAHLLPAAYWQAWVGVNTAQAGVEGAREALYVLYDMRNNPQQLQAQADAAEAEYRAAVALVEMAQAQLDGLRAGATAEEVAAVEAQVQQAQAQVESASVLLDKLTLRAPVSGQVLQVAAHRGELAVPGVSLLTIARLEEVTLTVYVPENRLGQIGVGQPVEVEVDSFPGRRFVGRVVRIATEAEFTPRNVQTEEQRVSMVFAVDISIPNPDYVLKPGMPADALIGVEER